MKNVEYKNMKYREKALRKILFLAILCALVLSISREASAQGGAVTLKAQAGIGGVCKIGAWMPIRVTVENRGADVESRVQVSYNNDLGGETIHAADLSLPSTSRKEFFIYLYPDSAARNFDVNVMDRDKLLATTKLNVSCKGDQIFVAGILSDSPSAFGVLNTIRPLAGTSRAVSLNVADLPDRAEGWSALNALIISNVDTGTLTVDQKHALHLWLAKGGKLFVTGGARWQETTAGLQDLLPVKITSTKNIARLSALAEYAGDEDALGATILSNGQIQQGAHVLVEQDGVPLLVEKRIGYGKVYYFAADPSSRPLNSWGGMSAVYEHLIFFQPQQPAWSGAEWDSYRVNNVVSALSELQMPNFLYVFCWLGLYIVAIGPVNYLILRRVKRMELAWVTIPILVIMFSCLAYFSGYAYRGFNPILNRVALAQGWDETPQARVNGLVGIYSPRRTSYDVITQDGFMLYAPKGIGKDLQGSNDWLSLKTNSGTSLPGARVEIGGIEPIGVEGEMSALNIQHNLAYNVNGAGVSFAGTITNASAYLLKDAALVTSDEWISIGDLKPNETYNAKHTFTDQPAIPPVDIYSIMNKLNLNENASAMDERRRALFFQSVVSYNLPLAPSGIYLMGWVDAVSLPVGLKDEQGEAVDTMLYFQKLEPALTALSSRPFTVTSHAYQWQSSINTLATTNIPEDGYEIRFQPDLPLRVGEASALNFNIQTSAAFNQVAFSIWDFQQKTWEQIPLSFNVSIPNAQNYLGMDGEIRVMFDVDQNSYTEIRSVDFTLEAQP